ncbi:hypothetical protein OQA88_2291 [Cercophora sp. LCS_1]
MASAKRPGETGNPSFGEVLSSRLFKFYIGPNKREFTMHSSLIAAQSPSFNILTNDSFEEAKDFEVEMSHVDERTFAYFAQYAYSGSYIVTEAEGKERAPQLDHKTLDQMNCSGTHGSTPLLIATAFLEHSFEEVDVAKFRQHGVSFSAQNTEKLLNNAKSRRLVGDDSELSLCLITNLVEELKMRYLPGAPVPN